MKLLLLLLLIILAPILYSIGKVWLAVRRAQKRFNEAYRDMQDAYRHQTGGNGTTKKAHKKPEGEYADFEEIESSDSTATDNNTSQQGSEPLITEAEYEEIN